MIIFVKNAGMVVEGESGQGTRIIDYMDRIEEMRKYYLVTTEHLEEGLWFREEGDFAVGMNHVAVQAALRPEVLVLAFILMSNHVHFVLYATEREAREFVEAIKCRYSQYLFRKYGIREVLRRNEVDVREIKTDDDEEALERAIAYVQMNCVEARICAHPSQYPWGTGNVFFSVRTALQQGKPIGSLSRRARARLLHSECDEIPDNWLVSDAGYVLPESYVKVSLVERIFRTPGRLNYFLNTSSKARKRPETGEDLPAFKDQTILQALPDLCRSLFSKGSFNELTESEQREMIRQLRFRFSANVNQAARVCGLTYDAAARLLDNA